MPNTVKVIVTSNQVGMWTTAPYSHELGLDTKAIYEVPIYEVKIDPGYSFKAVRFGLVNRNLSPPPKKRLCDAGLADSQSSKPSWVPTYSPASFKRDARVGAWRIYDGKGWLIHEGPADKYAVIGGSLGCIEIVGLHEWNRFLAAIEAVGGATCAEIGKARTLLLVIAKTFRPFATLL